MIEISTTEVLLFCWAILATAFAFKKTDQYNAATRFITLLVEHPEIIEQIREAEKQFNEGKV